jgi:hypothetical protein
MSARTRTLAAPACCSGTTSKRMYDALSLDVGGATGGRRRSRNKQDLISIFRRVGQRWRRPITHLRSSEQRALLASFLASLCAACAPGLAPFLAACASSLTALHAYRLRLGIWRGYDARCRKNGCRQSEQGKRLSPRDRLRVHDVRHGQTSKIARVADRYPCPRWCPFRRRYRMGSARVCTSGGMSAVTLDRTRQLWRDRGANHGTKRSNCRFAIDGVLPQPFKQQHIANGQQHRPDEHAK